ncbi:MAG: SRPBCC family protein, partial [Candidatus Omnitrophica bacterium]|nr:SRPBCC family protein [Candidatus Omnitrophota bacterium]
AMDPNSKISYEGASSGVGAVFKWAGNNQVGEGSNTIVESRPGELITIRLDFIKPFPGTSSAEFTFKPEGAGTMVTWSMSGKNNFIGKAMSLVMNCDKMVGGQFEKGLAGLKQVSEAK